MSYVFAMKAGTPPRNTPPPPDLGAVVNRAEAEALWEYGQALAAALERQAEDAQDDADRERLGDLADGLRGI